MIKYEDLVTDSKLIIEQILKFLQEEKYKHILDYHQNQKKWYSEEINKP